jgi:hypothetical protein
MTEINKKKINVIDTLAYFHVIVGNNECINISKKFIADRISNENNEILSLIIAELVLDDSTYFRFVLLSFEKDGPITDTNKITLLDNLLLKLNKRIQNFYRPIIDTTLNRPHDVRKLKIYIKLKRKILSEYINIFDKK